MTLFNSGTRAIHTVLILALAIGVATAPPPTQSTEQPTQSAQEPSGTAALPYGGDLAVPMNMKCWNEHKDCERDANELMGKFQALVELNRTLSHEIHIQMKLLNATKCGSNAYLYDWRDEHPSRRGDTASTSELRVVPQTLPSATTTAVVSGNSTSNATDTAAPTTSIYLSI